MNASGPTRGDLLWPSIPAMACDAAARFGDAVAVVDRGRRITFTELVADARRVTAALLAAGFEAGERAAVWSPNRYEWLVAALGILGAGGALVPVNTRFKGEEVRYILDRSGARVAFTVGEFLGVDYAATLAGLRSELPNLMTVVGFDDDTAADHSLRDFQATGDAIDDAALDVRIAAVGGGDVSDVLFTSGTTGAPKGVLMTHAQTLRQFSDWCDMAGLVEGDTYMIVNPFFHMFGYKAGCLASLMRGATIVPKPVFEVDDLLRTVADEQVTVFPGPPTVYQSILDHPARDQYDLSTLRLAVTGAADIPVELIRRMHEELPFRLIITGYGLTEAGTVTATGPDDDFETIATTVGRVRPGLEMRVVGDDGGELPTGEAGELLVRGYSVMRGYLDDPDATAATIDTDGWLHTGDLATVDGRGCARIVGRIKDMFIVGGFNAYPAEIENLLLAHPAVARAAVVGMPDARLGEVGMAFVVATPGSALEADELIAWSRDAMANYKVPRAVELVDELPVNAAGKVEKETLRARAAARHAPAAAEGEQA
ncbi:MAG TPA: FadD3 family acyl-CoA ligase [Acidimicrobiia bacterium]|nr:FadD3 family acyl-CoA ligase [Acidimicrobiia bacterium]